MAIKQLRLEQTENPKRANGPLSTCSELKVIYTALRLLSEHNEIALKAHLILGSIMCTMLVTQEPLQNVTDLALRLHREPHAEIKGSKVKMMTSLVV